MKKSNIKTAATILLLSIMSYVIWHQDRVNKELESKVETLSESMERNNALILNGGNAIKTLDRYTRTLIFQGAKWTPATLDSMVQRQMDAERYRGLVEELKVVSKALALNESDEKLNEKAGRLTTEVLMLEKKYQPNK